MPRTANRVTLPSPPTQHSLEPGTPNKPIPTSPEPFKLSSCPSFPLELPRQTVQPLPGCHTFLLRVNTTSASWFPAAMNSKTVTFVHLWTSLFSREGLNNPGLPPFHNATVKTLRRTSTVVLSFLPRPLSSLPLRCLWQGILKVPEAAVVTGWWRIESSSSLTPQILTEPLLTEGEVQDRRPDLVSSNGHYPQTQYRAHLLESYPIPPKPPSISLGLIFSTPSEDPRICSRPEHLSTTRSSISLVPSSSQDDSV